MKYLKNGVTNANIIDDFLHSLVFADDQVIMASGRKETNIRIYETVFCEVYCCSRKKPG